MRLAQGEASSMSSAAGGVRNRGHRRIAAAVSLPASCETSTRGAGGWLSLPQEVAFAMTIRWFLIASASRARVARSDGQEPLHIIAQLDHLASRRRASELGDDAAGREQTAQGFGGAPYAPHLDAHRKEHLRFARELAAHAEAGAKAGEFDALVLVAGNPFLGMLKEALGDAARRRLATTLDVDLTHVGAAELDQRIRQELGAAA
jgi:protein required for attachment to host cells